MQYWVFCIDLDNCGYTEVVESFPERLLCPECYELLLVYDTKDTPSFIKEIQPNEPASLGTGGDEAPDDGVEE
jgi:hypothetical protein